MNAEYGSFLPDAEHGGKRLFPGRIHGKLDQSPLAEGRDKAELERFCGRRSTQKHGARETVRDVSGKVDVAGLDGFLALLVYGAHCDIARLLDAHVRVLREERAALDMMVADEMEDLILRDQCLVVVAGAVAQV